MSKGLQKPQRRSIRLFGRDYSQSGAYFITICVDKHKCLFGQVFNETMQLNSIGKVIQQVWNDLPIRFPLISLDAFTIMPNHFHGIIVINDTSDVGAELALPEYTNKTSGAASSAPTLGDIVRAFKSISGIQVNKLLNRTGPLWQRNYFEHIIRNGNEHNHIREYIETNPILWEIDRENPSVNLVQLSTIKRHPWLV
ncbi:MAG: transposase [bacterium]|nr:transposase [bacterium]